MAITPGTWEVWQSPSGKWAVKAVYEDDQGNRHTTWPAVCNATGEDNEANARLIAAAPEMLEALRTLVERIEHYAKLEASGDAPGIEQWAYTEGSSDVAAARAAIEKAEWNDYDPDC